MAAAFLGEKIPRATGPVSMSGGPYYHDPSFSPPSSSSSPFSSSASSTASAADAASTFSESFPPTLHSADAAPSGFAVSAWLEVWDYVGGASFRAFVAEADQAVGRSLFVFLDMGVALGCDLKQA